MSEKENSSVYANDDTFCCHFICLGKDFITEKSELPKKEMLPLTNEEEDMLTRLSGSEKRKYIKSLKKKYKGE